MVCVCRPLHAPSLLPHHRPLVGNMFISRHDMRLAYTYCDPRVQLLIGYDPCELLGRTVYQFHNPVDAHKCSECHSSLIKTGSGVSRYYRYLGKTGVWVWMQTRATIVSDTRGQPQYVVCNNYIISQKEGDHSHQMELQQRAQSQGQQGLLAGDLLAKGALELSSLTQATSPVSVTDSEHEQHDDTGYSSAVSSMGSATTSPCPLIGVGGGLDLDPCLLSPHQQLGLHQEVPKERDSDELEASLVQGLESATELGFHSTLSSAIYGEFGMQDLPSSLDPLAGSGGDEDMADGFDMNPLPTVPDQHADPFLCEAESGRGRGEGSLTNVMEDMEVLDNLLQDIGRECDSSHDAVFPVSPLSQSSHTQGDTGCDGEAQSVSVENEGSVVTGSLVSGQSQCTRTPGERAQKEPCVLTVGMDSARPPSLLRTLLDREGKAVKASPPVIEAWTRSVPAVSLSSGKVTSGLVTSQKGQTAHADKTHTAGAASKDRQQSSVGGSRKLRSPVGLGGSHQLMVCGGKQVMVPRQVDLTAEHSDEEGEGLSNHGDDVNLQSVLPEELMDFAMQYCDPASDRDSLQTDILAEVEAHVWDSMEHLMAADTPDTPCQASGHSQAKSGKDTSEKVSSTLDQISRDGPEKECGDKHGDRGAVSKTLTLTSARPPASSSETSCVIQSDIISSTRQDLKPTITIIKSSGVGGGKAQPVTNDKMVAVLKQYGFSTNSQTKCCTAISPALSDHKYSSTRTLSPNPCSHPPSGKRMRTHWDKSDSPREKQDTERELRRTHCIDSPSLPSKVSDPPCKGQAVAGQGISPKYWGSSHQKPVSPGSKPSSQPTSPVPAPVPVNGGGKPLTAMSELEKHLRGLVAPPDERKKDPDDSLVPLEESCRSGSKPFLELLLTGEISHERYRQIDYHLLYQERERRLEENGQSS